MLLMKMRNRRERRTTLLRSNSSASAEVNSLDITTDPTTHLRRTEQE
jgi:hypothetical protein